MIPSYCITLPSTPERTAGAKAEFARAGISPQFVTGIDGRAWGLRSSIPYEEPELGGRPNYTLPGAKIGLLLSHWMVWQRIAQGDAPAAIVFEDDVSLGERFVERFEAAYAVLPDDWQMTYLGWLASEKCPRFQINSRVAVIHWPQCLHSYMIKREIADVLMKEVCQAHTSADIAVLSLVLPSIRHYEFTPPLTGQRTLSGEWPTTMIDDLPVRKEIERLIPTLNGWCTVKKALWFAEQILQRQPSLVVEIGVFGGRSLVPMALAIKSLQESRPAYRGRVVGIDPYDRDSVLDGLQEQAHRDWWAQVDLAKVSRDCDDAIGAADVRDVCEMVKQTSQQAAGLFTTGEIDLLHIDGTHSEIASLRDVRVYYPLVRPGGLIVLDDTNWPGVEAARKLLESLCGQAVHVNNDPHDSHWQAFRKPLCPR